MPAAVIETLEKDQKGAVQAAPSKKRHGILHMLVEAFVAIVCVIATLEVLFAMAGVGEQEYLRVDKVLGFCPMEGRHVTWRKEGFGRIQFNSQGMNGHEYPLQKPAGVYRIAIVGDSFVEAVQVDREKNFCSMLEKKLNARYGGPNHRIEVMNFGCSANSMGQFYKKIQTKILPYHPDVVIAGMSVDATKLLAPLQGGFAFANARPTFLIKDGKLVEDWQIFNWWNHSPDGKRFARTAFLRQYSHIWGAIGTMMGSYQSWVADLQAGKVWGWGAPPQPAAPVARAEDTAKVAPPVVQPNVDAPQKLATTRDAQTKLIAEKAANYKGPVSGPFLEQSVSPANKIAVPQAQGDVDAATRQYWPVADQLIRAMQKECTDHDCRFAILHLPARPEVGFDNPRETSLLSELCHKLSIPYYDLTPAFLSAPKQVALIYSVHMTPAGHVLTESEIEKYIEANHLAGK